MPFILVGIKHQSINQSIIFQCRWDQLYSEHHFTTFHFFDNQHLTFLEFILLKIILKYMITHLR
jgi:hypothetical protein